MNLSAVLRPRSFRVSVLVVLAFSLMLTRFPLVNSLGYEFSTATALFMSVLSGLLTIGLFRSRFKNLVVASRHDLLAFQKVVFFQNLLLLAAPFAVVTLNLFEVKNCSYLEGVAFYFLIPCITALFSAAFATLCAVSLRRPRLGYFAILALILLHILALGYFTPQIHAYNFILGYFPGFSYDEVLTITPTLVLFRVVTLIASACCFSLSVLVVESVNLDDKFAAKVEAVWNRLPENKLHKWVAFASFFALAASWILRAELGFETTLSVLRHELSKIYQTEHFSIHYAENSFSEEELQGVGEEHEFRLQQVSQKLQIPFDGLIDSYIYPSERLKRRLIGAGGTNIAKPWRREIHVNKDSWTHVLKHELAHVVAGEFGLPVIRAHYNIGLVEGLAMAVEWNFGNRTPHEYAAAIKSFGLLQDPRGSLTMSGFALQASTLSYVLSGSFSRFLIDRYGMMRFKELYGGTSFKGVYGKDVDALSGEWMNFLDRIEIRDEWKPHVEFYFDRKSIFAKECARHIALLNRGAYDALDNRDPLLAMRLFGASLGESWNSEALVGLVRAAYVSARYDTIIALLDAQLSARAATLANLMLPYGDALWYRDDLISARKAFEDVLRIDLSESSAEAAALRIAVLDDARIRVQVIPVFVGFESDSVKLQTLGDAEIQNPIIKVLQAQLLYRSREYEETIRVLEALETFDQHVMQFLVEKLKGLSYFQMGELQRARVQFWQAMNYTDNDASKLRLSEWIDRCEWLAKVTSKK